MAYYKWYEIATTDDVVTQGDIIENCPVAQVVNKDAFPFFEPEGAIIKGIIMTQACDLENNTVKVKDLTICPLVPLQNVLIDLMNKQYSQVADFDYSNLSGRQQEKKGKIIDDIRKGNYLDFYLLDNFSSEEQPKLNQSYQVVLLRNTYHIPVEAANKIIKYNGGTRLRLQPPYREHLAQAYTFNFSRIGLPIDIKVDHKTV